MQSSQVRNVGLPSSADTKRDVPAWTQDPKIFPLDWFSVSRPNIIRQTKEYVSELSKWRNCPKIKTLSKLKAVLKRIMMFLHTHISYIDGKSLLECDLEEDLITLVSLYVDMELRVLLIKKSATCGATSTTVPGPGPGPTPDADTARNDKLVSDRISYWLYTVLTGHDQRIDALLSTTVFTRHTRPVLDPIFRKILSEMSDGPFTNINYVRHMLAYKTWRERTLVVDDTASLELNSRVLQQLVPREYAFPPPLLRCLGKGDNAREHARPHNINLADACRNFMRYCREIPAAAAEQINFESIPLFDDDLLGDEDAEVNKIMNMISSRKQRKSAPVSPRRSSHQVDAFIDLTVPKSRAGAICGNPTSLSDVIDLTEEDEKPIITSRTAAVVEHSASTPLRTTPAIQRISASKKPQPSQDCSYSMAPSTAQVETRCFTAYRDQDIYLVNISCMCPVRAHRQRECQCQDKKIGYYKENKSVKTLKERKCENDATFVGRCFQFSIGNQYTYPSEDNVESEMQPLVVGNSQDQVKLEMRSSTAVTCNKDESRVEATEFCDKLFSASLNHCDCDGCKRRDNLSRYENRTCSSAELKDSKTEISDNVQCRQKSLVTYSHPPSVADMFAMEKTNPIVLHSQSSAQLPENKKQVEYFSETLDKRKLPSIENNDYLTPREDTLNNNFRNEIKKIKLPVVQTVTDKRPDNVALSNENIFQDNTNVTASIESESKLSVVPNEEISKSTNVTKNISTINSEFQKLSTVEDFSESISKSTETDNLDETAYEISKKTNAQSVTSPLVFGTRIEIEQLCSELTDLSYSELPEKETEVTETMCNVLEKDCVPDVTVNVAISNFEEREDIHRTATPIEDQKMKAETEILSPSVTENTPISNFGEREDIQRTVSPIEDQESVFLTLQVPKEFENCISQENSNEQETQILVDKEVTISEETNSNLTSNAEEFNNYAFHKNRNIQEIMDTDTTENCETQMQVPVEEKVTYAKVTDIHLTSGVPEGFENCTSQENRNAQESINTDITESCETQIINHEEEIIAQKIDTHLTSNVSEEFENCASQENSNEKSMSTDILENSKTQILVEKEVTIAEETDNKLTLNVPEEFENCAIQENRIQQESKTENCDTQILFKEVTITEENDAHLKSNVPEELENCASQENSKEQESMGTDILENCETQILVEKEVTITGETDTQLKLNVPEEFENCTIPENRSQQENMSTYMTENCNTQILVQEEVTITEENDTHIKSNVTEELENCASQESSNEQESMGTDILENYETQILEEKEVTITGETDTQLKLNVPEEFENCTIPENRNQQESMSTDMTENCKTQILAQEEVTITEENDTHLKSNVPEELENCASQKNSNEQESMGTDILENCETQILVEKEVTIAEETDNKLTLNVPEEFENCTFAENRSQQESKTENCDTQILFKEETMTKENDTHLMSNVSEELENCASQESSNEQESMGTDILENCETQILVEKEVTIIGETDTQLKLNVPEEFENCTIAENRSQRESMSTDMTENCKTQILVQEEVTITEETNIHLTSNVLEENCTSQENKNEFENKGIDTTENCETPILVDKNETIIKTDVSVEQNCLSNELENISTKLIEMETIIVAENISQNEKTVTEEFTSDIPVINEKRKDNFPQDKVIQGIIPPAETIIEETVNENIHDCFPKITAEINEKETKSEVSFLPNYTESVAENISSEDISTNEITITEKPASYTSQMVESRRDNYAQEEVIEKISIEKSNIIEEHHSENVHYPDNATATNFQRVEEIAPVVEMVESEIVIESEIPVASIHDIETTNQQISSDSIIADHSNANKEDFERETEIAHEIDTTNFPTSSDSTITDHFNTNSEDFIPEAKTTSSDSIIIDHSSTNNKDFLHKTKIYSEIGQKVVATNLPTNSDSIIVDPNTNFEDFITEAIISTDVPHVIETLHQQPSSESIIADKSNKNFEDFIPKTEIIHENSSVSKRKRRTSLTIHTKQKEFQIAEDCVPKMSSTKRRRCRTSIDAINEEEKIEVTVHEEFSPEINNHGIIETAEENVNSKVLRSKSELTSIEECLKKTILSKESNLVDISEEVTQEEISCKEQISKRRRKQNLKVTFKLDKTSPMEEIPKSEKIDSTAGKKLVVKCERLSQDDIAILSKTNQTSFENNTQVQENVNKIRPILRRKNQTLTNNVMEDTITQETKVTVDEKELNIINFDSANTISTKTVDIPSFSEYVGKEKNKISKIRSRPRRKKQVDNNENKNKQSENQITSTSSILANVTTDVKVKRPRGRPPKNSFFSENLNLQNVNSKNKNGLVNGNDTSQNLAISICKTMPEEDVPLSIRKSLSPKRNSLKIFQKNCTSNVENNIINNEDDLPLLSRKQKLKSTKNIKHSAKTKLNKTFKEESNCLIEQNKIKKKSFRDKLNQFKYKPRSKTVSNDSVILHQEGIGAPSKKNLNSEKNSKQYLRTYEKTKSLKNPELRDIEYAENSTKTEIKHENSIIKTETKHEDSIIKTETKHEDSIIKIETSSKNNKNSEMSLRRAERVKIKKIREIPDDVNLIEINNKSDSDSGQSSNKIVDSSPDYSPSIERQVNCGERIYNNTLNQPKLINNISSETKMTEKDSELNNDQSKIIPAVERPLKNNCHLNPKKLFSKRAREKLEIQMKADSEDNTKNTELKFHSKGVSNQKTIEENSSEEVVNNNLEQLPTSKLVEHKTEEIENKSVQELSCLNYEEKNPPIVAEEIMKSVESSESILSKFHKNEKFFNQPKDDIISKETSENIISSPVKKIRNSKFPKLKFKLGCKFNFLSKNLRKTVKTSPTLKNRKKKKFKSKLNGSNNKNTNVNKPEESIEMNGISYKSELECDKNINQNGSDMNKNNEMETTIGKHSTKTEVDKIELNEIKDNETIKEITEENITENLRQLSEAVLCNINEKEDNNIFKETTEEKINVNITQPSEEILSNNEEFPNSAIDQKEKMTTLDKGNQNHHITNKLESPQIDNKSEDVIHKPCNKIYEKQFDFYSDQDDVSNSELVIDTSAESSDAEDGTENKTKGSKNVVQNEIAMPKPKYHHRIEEIVNLNENIPNNFENIVSHITQNYNTAEITSHTSITENPVVEETVIKTFNYSYTSDEPQKAVKDSSRNMFEEPFQKTEECIVDHNETNVSISVVEETIVKSMSVEDTIVESMAVEEAVIENICKEQQNIGEKKDLTECTAEIIEIPEEFYNECNFEELSGPSVEMNLEEISPCTLTAKVNSARICKNDSSPVLDNYKLFVLADIAMSSVYLTTKPDNNNSIMDKPIDSSVDSHDKCMIVTFPNNMTPSSKPTRTVSVIQDNNTLPINVQKLVETVPPKGIVLENKIQVLTERAKNGNKVNGENLDDLYKSLENICELEINTLVKTPGLDSHSTLPAQLPATMPTDSTLDNSKISEPSIPIDIPNTALLHLTPDDDDFIIRNESFILQPNQIQLSSVKSLPEAAVQNKSNLDATGIVKNLFNAIDSVTETQKTDNNSTDQKSGIEKEPEIKIKSKKGRKAKSSTNKNSETNYLLNVYKNNQDSNKNSDTINQQNVNNNKNTPSPQSYIRSTRPMRMVTTRKRNSNILENNQQDEPPKKVSTSEKMFDLLLEKHKKEQSETKLIHKTSEKNAEKENVNVINTTMPVLDDNVPKTTSDNDKQQIPLPVSHFAVTETDSRKLDTEKTSRNEEMLKQKTDNQAEIETELTAVQTEKEKQFEAVTVVQTDQENQIEAGTVVQTDQENQIEAGTVVQTDKEKQIEADNIIEEKVPETTDRNVSAIKVVQDWFNRVDDNKLQSEPYTEITSYQTIEKCNFFKEMSNTSENSPNSRKTDDKVFSEHQTPDSGIAFDEDSVQKDKSVPENLYDANGEPPTTNFNDLDESMTGSITETQKTNNNSTDQKFDIENEPEVKTKPKKGRKAKSSTNQSSETNYLLNVHKSNQYSNKNSDTINQQNVNNNNTPSPQSYIRSTRPMRMVATRKTNSNIVEKNQQDEPPTKVSVSEKMFDLLLEKHKKEQSEAKLIHKTPKNAEKENVNSSSTTMPVLDDNVPKTTSDNDEQQIPLSVLHFAVTETDSRKLDTEKSSRNVEEMLKQKTDNQAEIEIELTAVQTEKEKQFEAVTVVQTDQEKQIETGTVVQTDKEKLIEAVTVVQTDQENQIEAGTVVQTDQENQIESGTVVQTDKEKQIGADNTIEEEVPNTTDRNVSAIEVVQDWFNRVDDNKLQSEPYTEITSYQTIEECNFFEEMSNTSENSPNSRKTDDKVFSEHQTPDSGIAFDEDSVQKDKSVPENLSDADGEPATTNFDELDESMSGSIIEKVVVSDSQLSNSYENQLKVSISLERIQEILPHLTKYKLTSPELKIRKRKDHNIDCERAKKMKYSTDDIEQSPIIEESCSDDDNKRKRRQYSNDDIVPEFNSEEVKSPALSQKDLSVPVRTKGSVKEYPDCLFGITESPVPSGSFHSPYPSDISLTEEPTFYEEGGIDLCNDYPCYDSFEVLQEQQSLQKEYNVVDDNPKDVQQGLQAGYCVVDSQFLPLSEYMNDGDYILIDNKIFNDKKMVPVNMHLVQPETKPHNSEETKKSEFDDSEKEDSLSDTVEEIIKNPKLFPEQSTSEVQLINMDQATSEVQVVIACGTYQETEMSDTYLFGIALQSEVNHSDSSVPDTTLPQHSPMTIEEIPPESKVTDNSDFKPTTPIVGSENTQICNTDILPATDVPQPESMDLLTAVAPVTDSLVTDTLTNIEKLPKHNIENKQIESINDKKSKHKPKNSDETEKISGEKIFPRRTSISEPHVSSVALKIPAYSPSTPVLSKSQTPTSNSVHSSSYDSPKIFPKRNSAKSPIMPYESNTLSATKAHDPKAYSLKTSNKSLSVSSNLPSNKVQKLGDCHPGNKMPILSNSYSVHRSQNVQKQSKIYDSISSHYTSSQLTKKPTDVKMQSKSQYEKTYNSKVSEDAFDRLKHDKTDIPPPPNNRRYYSQSSSDTNYLKNRRKDIPSGDYYRRYSIERDSSKSRHPTQSLSDSRRSHSAYAESNPKSYRLPASDPSYRSSHNNYRKPEVKKQDPKPPPLAGTSSQKDWLKNETLLNLIKASNTIYSKKY